MERFKGRTGKDYLDDLARELRPYEVSTYRYFYKNNYFDVQSEIYKPTIKVCFDPHDPENRRSVGGPNLWLPAVGLAILSVIGTRLILLRRHWLRVRDED